MEGQVNLQKPVFGVGAPKANETSIRITSPVRGRQDVPVVFRSRDGAARLLQAAEQREPASPVGHVARSVSRRS